jgi:hypothetical protein
VFRVQGVAGTMEKRGVFPEHYQYLRLRINDQCGFKVEANFKYVLPLSPTDIRGLIPGIIRTR